MSQNNIIRYWCEFCNETVYWTAEDYAAKGEPVCPVCNNDMKVLSEAEPESDE